MSNGANLQLEVIPKCPNAGQGMQGATVQLDHVERILLRESKPSRLALFNCDIGTRGRVLSTEHEVVEDERQ